MTRTASDALALHAPQPLRSQRTAFGIVVALFVLAVLVQLLLMRRVVAGYDEGLILYGAARVARGEVPYRDFWSMYGPGSFYVLGALFQAFGESVAVARAFDVASRALIVVLVFALVAEHGAAQVPAPGARGARGPAPHRAAVVAALTALGLLVIAPGYEFPVYPALAFALVAVAAVGRAAEAPTRWQPWLGAGVATGLAATFRHDLGAYTMLACLYALALTWRRGGATFGPRSIAGGALLGGFLLGAGLPLAWLLREVPAADLIDNLVRIPFLVYASNRHLPLPSLPGAVQQALASHSAAPLFALAFYAPIAVALAAIAVAVRARRARRGQPLAAVHVVFETLTVLTLLYCLKAALRAGSMHVMPALVLAVVPAALMLAQRGSRLLWGLALAGVAALVGVRVWMSADELGAPARAGFEATTGPGAAPRAAAGAPPTLARWAGCEPQPIERLRCFRVDPARAAVLAYLDRHATPGAPIYVGAGRHDKLFVNNVELYFLSGHPASTRWHDLHPGVQTTRAVQAEMLRELTARPPQFVVINTEWDDLFEPNASAVSSGVTLLDEHLRAHYRPVFSAGSFTVSARRDAAAPLSGGPP